jgi:hypothetical protein
LRSSGGELLAIVLVSWKLLNLARSSAESKPAVRVMKRSVVPAKRRRVSLSTP